MLDNNHIMERALECRVTSENLIQLFNMEEIIAIKHLLNISEHIFIESLLLSYIYKTNHSIPEEYLNTLTHKKLNEEKLISKTVNILKSSLRKAPKEIKQFLTFYALEALNSEHNKIFVNISKLLTNPKNVKFLDDLELKLNLKNSIFALDLLRAIKLKYAEYEDIYYIHSLIWYSKYISLGLLYIFTNV